MLHVENPFITLSRSFNSIHKVDACARPLKLNLAVFPDFRHTVPCERGLRQIRAMDTSLSNHVNFDNTENKANVSNTSSQVTAGDGIGVVSTSLKNSLAKVNLHSNHIKDINKLKDEKHKEQKIKEDKHKLEKHKHHKEEKKHREDKVKDKHKEEKLKDKQKVEKSKDEKHKDHKHKDIHNSTGKPKDSQQISSPSSSSSSKLKENHMSHSESPKVKEGSSLSKITEDGKLKEKFNNSSNSITKPKISSSSKSHSVSVNDKSKDQTHKPKEHNSSSSKKLEEKKHHSSSSEKIKSPDSTHKREHLNNKSERKPDGKEKEHEKHKTEEKRNKDEKKHKEKENHEKLKEHISKHKEGEHNATKEKIKEVKVKTEPSSPMKSLRKELSPVKAPIKEFSPMKTTPKMKEEAPSDDDTPLTERKMKNSIKNSEENNRISSGHLTIKSVKRSTVNDSDEEPLSVRMAKKVKVEQKERKRRMDDSDDEPARKKKKKIIENKFKDQKDVIPSPKKKAKAGGEEKEVWKWWEEEKYDGRIKWKTLEHKGPVFAPPYEKLPSNVKFYYDGKHFVLSDGAEEVASFYAKMLEHDYTTKEAFNNNFFKDWRRVMTSTEKNLIKDLKKCNFSDMNQYFNLKSEERKNMTKEEKQEIKKKNEEIMKAYGTCVIDGHTEKIGNFKIEPPGLFRGRGEHPKMGMLKQRIMPEDVIINCSKNENIPKPPAGHKWREIRHDNTVTWLACWTENIQNQTKYVMLNASSKLKGEKDWQKYEVARKLKQYVDKIREQYKIDWKSKEMKVRQRAVALYFIDKLALRAGNEKEEGETADTVGCCSLRVEHINLVEKKRDQDYVVEFDFLGKDSIRYQNSVPVEKRVFKNLQLFIENKKPDDDLFDRLNTSILNKHLNELMEGLTAKVFRTFNASKTLQEQLDLLTRPGDSIPAKILSYNRANRAVAILCNHQRSIPKTFGKSMENLQNKIKAKKDQVDDCERECKQLKKDAKRNRSTKDQQLYERKKKALERLQEQLNKLEVQATDKEENKDIALGTSKLNYLDPRISVAWCKKWNVPVEKIYNKTQRDKFRWAIEMAGPDFKF